MKRLGLGALLGLAGGYAASFLSPRIYEARAEIWIQGDDPSRQASNLGDSLATQLAILRSEGVFRSALQWVGKRQKDPELAKQHRELFRMYEVDVKPGSAVAVVQVRAYKPETAALVANEIAKTYRETRAAATNEAEASKQEGFYSRLNRARDAVEVAERRLQEYKASTGVPDLGQKAQQVIGYEASLTARLDSARSELQQVEQEIRTQNAEIRRIPQRIRIGSVRQRDPEVTALQEKLNDLQRQRIELLRTYTETSTRVRGIDEAIATTRQQLLNASTKPWQDTEQQESIDPRWLELNKLRAQNLVRRSALRAEIGQVQSQLGRVRSEMARLPRAQARQQLLQREYDLAMSRYRELERKAAELETSSVTAAQGAVTLMRASPDRFPVSPNVPLLMALGTALGLIGGGIYSLSMERGRKPLRTPGQLEQLTGLPAAAATALPRREQERLLRALPEPGSRPAEAFRFMALSNPPGENGASVLFTSVGGDFGCSSAAGQFALAMACEGRITMLVDCDFRTCSLTDAFRSHQKPGLSDILRKTLLPGPDNEVSFRTHHENLLFLPSGSCGDGSIADFSHTQLRSAMEMLREQAEVLVLDAPPCDQVTDAVRLAPLVDHVYLVVDAEDSGADRVAMAHRMLERCGAKDVQVILSNADRGAAPFAAT